MRTRLQVILDEEELREIKRIARQHRMTVAEWVRQALRAARGEHEPASEAPKKLDVLRATSRHTFPTGDIQQVLRDIEQGSMPPLPR